MNGLQVDDSLMPLLRRFDKPVGKGQPYRLGLALSGGGSRGLAHVGALLAIHEAGLRVDVIAGVSAGSVVAVMYAAGVHPFDIVELFKDRGLTDFAELSPKGGGLFRLDRFRRFVMKAIEPYKALEDLPMPCYVGATDFDRGMPVEFHSGPIGERVIASCTVPIMFKPVKIDGTWYVDGGVLRNLPSWIIRDKCDKLIGVNVSPMKIEGQPDTIVNVALRTYALWSKANQNEDMAMCDATVITPEISHIKPFSLKQTHKMVVSGYLHTRAALKAAGMWEGAGRD